MKTSRTPRFEKDLLSHPDLIRKDIKSLVKLIRRTPIPPIGNPDWKELEQFRSICKIGRVYAMFITLTDRLVYEVSDDLTEIVFTNCKGHNYRGNHYSK